MMSFDSIISSSDIKAVKEDIHAPLYHLIYSMLKDRILNGTLSYQERLPTEHELAAIFNVSRITAKRALDELASEGLVHRCLGRGTHVEFEYHNASAGKTPLVDDLQDLATIAEKNRCDSDR